MGVGHPCWQVRWCGELEHCFWLALATQSGTIEVVNTKRFLETNLENFHRKPPANKSEARREQKPASESD